MRAIRLFSLFVLIATFAVGLVSCGGSGGTSVGGRGSLRVSVHWPSGRDIPPATRSIKVTAVTLIQNEDGQKVEDTEVGEKVVARPQGQATSDVTLEDLPSVEVRVKVSAYASTDGTGSVLASGTDDIQVPESDTANASITLHAGLSLIEPDPGNLFMAVNESRSIFMIARLSDGTQTTIDENRWGFISAQPSIATVAKRASPNGHIADVTGVSEGTTSIQIRDSQTGLSVQVPVTVDGIGGNDHCQEYAASVGTQNASGRTPVHLFDGASSASAFGDAGNVVSFGGGFAKASAVDYYTVEAPGIAGPFQAGVRYRAGIRDNNPDFPGSSGTVTVMWMDGVKTFSDFGVFDEVVPVTLHDGDVVRLAGSAQANSSPNVGAAADFSIFFVNLPAGVHLTEANCS